MIHQTNFFLLSDKSKWSAEYCDVWEQALSTHWLTQDNFKSHYHKKKRSSRSLRNPVEEFKFLIIDLDDVEPSFIKNFSSYASIEAWTPVLIIGSPKTAYMLSLLGDYFLHKVLIKPYDKTALLNAMTLLLQDSKRIKSMQQKRILAIGAHPDDIEYGMGGSLYLFKEQGHQLHFLIMSHGEQGGDPEVRKHELYSSAARLNVDSLCIHELDDTGIRNDLNTIRLISEVVVRVSPTHIFTHSSNDSHQDHRAVHASSVVACREMHNFFCFQSPSSTVDFRPTYFIDISDKIINKIGLLSCYKSQNKSYLQPSVVKATAIYWGVHSKYGFAEAFETYKLTS